MIISIQGKLGSYSHIAANSYFGNKIELLQRDTFTEVFDDLKNDNAKYIVVPIENSTHGSVYQNYDNLSNYGFHVIGEVYLKIAFHLISFKDTKFEDITTIYSHPVGLNQIKKFLKEHPQIKAIEYPDTAGSVEFIKNSNDQTAGAAASRFAAEIYDMNIISENIHENSKNYTRFFVLSKNNHTSKDADKTTIQFELGEEAGSLYKSLRCFADRNIALTKIESRPILDTDWEYRFYVDVLAGEQEEKLQNALKELTSYVRHLKILGTYKKGEYINT